VLFPWCSIFGIPASISWYCVVPSGHWIIYAVNEHQGSGDCVPHCLHEKITLLSALSLSSFKYLCSFQRILFMAFQRCSNGFKLGLWEGCSATQMPCESNHSLPISSSGYHSTKSLSRSNFLTVMWKNKLNMVVGRVLCKNTLCLKLGGVGWGWYTDFLIITVVGYHSIQK